MSGMTGNIAAIFFDMNGTLRTREPDAPTQAAALLRLRQMLGKSDAAEDYWETLSQRFQVYADWARAGLTQASEAEIWTRWILPEEPAQRVAVQADELMLAWIERKGRAIPRPGAQAVLQELQRRGYRLGVISNTISTLDVPRFIRANGWQALLQVVVLSAEMNSRKPAPELFNRALERMRVANNRCAYVGNRLAKDIVGCKRAGFALGIMLETPGLTRMEEVEAHFQADRVIQSLEDLLDIFPGVGQA